VSPASIASAERLLDVIETPHPEKLDYFHELHCYDRICITIIRSRYQDPDSTRLTSLIRVSLNPSVVKFTIRQSHSARKLLLQVVGVQLLITLAGYIYTPLFFQPQQL
jgi:hypothetical protein